MPAKMRPDVDSLPTLRALMTKSGVRTIARSGVSLSSLGCRLN